MQRRTKVMIAGGRGGRRWRSAAPASPSPAAPTTTPPTRRSPGPTSSGPRPPRSPTPASGRVTETEVGDEESYYEVEVTLDDGPRSTSSSTSDFNVVGDEADDESEAGRLTD